MPSPPASESSPSSPLIASSPPTPRSLSLPRPPERVSMPLLPVMSSAPSPPVAIFVPGPRVTWSLPVPPSTLALPVNLVPSATWSDLARRITRDHRGEYVLVSGNLNTVPQLVEALSGQKVTLREDEYDAMFIVFVPQISKKKVVRVRY